jgi:murein DD-endopeptidase MepM/ murein hydrolase activator NlpD
MHKRQNLITFAALFGFSTFFVSCTSQSTPSETFANADQEAAIAEAPPLFLKTPFQVEQNSTVYNSLRQAGLNPAVIHEIVNAANPVHNLSRVRPGTEAWIYHEAHPLKELRKVKFALSKRDRLVIELNDEAQWIPEIYSLPVDIQLVSFSGVVESSLWESASQAGMSPLLIDQLANIFAWEVDFNREVRVHDRWRLTVEQEFIEGEPIGWGRILSAEYENSGRLFSGVLFPLDSENAHYYRPDGGSLRKVFLKSPMKFGRVTSGFQRNRFHPILKVNRPHHGVDYGAPTGTPVHSIGEGKVTYRGWNGGSGNTLVIRHNSVYETTYRHLHGYAGGLRVGSTVSQGQTIGYVGQTGLATGPHLHFELRVNGRVVDPLRVEFPSADPVPQKLLESFQEVASHSLSLLPAWGQGERENLVSFNQTELAAKDSGTQE